MQSEHSGSHSLHIFLSKLTVFLQSSGLSFQDFIANLKPINPNQLSKLEFFRIVSLLSIEQLSGFSSFNAFQELSKGGETIGVAMLKEWLSRAGKEGEGEIQKRRQEDKAKEQDMRKKVVRLAIYKLIQFMKQSDNPMKLLSDFDVDKNGSLSRQQFNGFLISTEIREFSSRQIRKILIDSIYKYFLPHNQISLHELAVFFKIVPKNQNQSNQNVNKNDSPSKGAPKIVQPQNKPSEPKPFQPKPFSPKPFEHKPFEQKLPEKKITDPKFPQQKPAELKPPLPKISQPISSPFTKKNHQQNPYQNILKPTQPIIQNPNFLGVNQPKPHQDSKNIYKQEPPHQNIFGNFEDSFPQAMQYFKLGEPMPSEMEVLQELEDLLRKGKVFEDVANPKPKEGVYVRAKDIFKTRFYIFQMASSVLMREKSRIGIARDIQPKDIIQGEVGDCYLLSSIASLISIYPQLVAERFLFEINDACFYAVRLFIDGQWKTIRTDDRFACKGIKPIYAKPHTNEIWVMLLEKCWAKVYGSYAAIQSGSSKEGFLALTGAPSEIFNLSKEKSEQEIVKQLEIAQKKRYVATMSGSSYLQSLPSSVQDKLGLVGGHAYSFLKMVQINGERLIKMRNPWGKTIWTGDWSFESSRWTRQLREKYNYVRSPEDGSFYMPWREFARYFSQVVICKLNPTYVHESLRLRSNKRKSSYVQMTVRAAGQYILSIYQPSKRKYQNYGNYEYSASRLIVLKKSQGRLSYVGARSVSQTQICSLDMELQEGKYLISAKVFWKHWTQEEFVLTSYAGEKVLFQNVNRAVAPQFKKSLIQSYTQQSRGSGKVKNYQKYGFKASCETNFSIDTGLGYVLMVNDSDKRFESTLQMKVSGLKPIKPARLPLEFKMAPHSRELVGFFVSASGYEYSSSQKIKYY